MAPYSTVPLPLSLQQPTTLLPGGAAGMPDIMALCTLPMLDPSLQQQGASVPAIPDLFALLSGSTSGAFQPVAGLSQPSFNEFGSTAAAELPSLLPSCGLSSDLPLAGHSQQLSQPPGLPCSMFPVPDILQPGTGKQALLSTPIKELAPPPATTGILNPMGALLSGAGYPTSKGCAGFTSPAASDSPFASLMSTPDAAFHSPVGLNGNTVPATAAAAAAALASSGLFLTAGLDVGASLPPGSLGSSPGDADLSALGGHTNALFVSPDALSPGYHPAGRSGIGGGSGEGGYGSPRQLGSFLDILADGMEGPGTGGGLLMGDGESSQLSLGSSPAGRKGRL
jgi:hypothetical protein